MDGNIVDTLHNRNGNRKEQQSMIVKELFRYLISSCLMFTATFITDVTDVLDKHELEYQIVDVIEQSPGAMAFYEFSTGIMYFSKRAVGNSGERFRYYAAHELIHKIRFERGMWTGNQRIEEAIAVYGACRVSKLIGFGGTSIKEWPSLRSSLRANGLEEKYLSRSEMDTVEQQVFVTISHIRDLFVK